MFGEENLSKDENDKALRLSAKERGKHLKRAKSAYGKLTDAEKIFLNYYLADPEMSFGSAVLKSGLADSNEDVLDIALALKNDERIQAALEEIEQLGGIGPKMVKKGLLKLIQNSKDENIQLKALQTLGDYFAMKVHVIKHDGPAVQLDSEEIKARISVKLPDILAESKEIISAKLKDQQ